MSYSFPLLGVVCIVFIIAFFIVEKNTGDPVLPGLPNDVVEADVSNRQSVDDNDGAQTNIEIEDQQPLREIEETARVETREVGVSQEDAIDFAESIAHKPLDNNTIIRLADELRNNPDKYFAVLNEFSTEVDPERLNQLRLLLGQLDDPSMVSVAESMMYSGNAESSTQALRLLRDIGSKVPAARELGAGLLANTQDPKLLVGATNILAGGPVSDEVLRERVVSSLSSLVEHSDATVRRASFSSLARWAKDPSHTPTLLRGLSDEDPNVRKSTAYGFVGYPYPDATVISALLATAENTLELKRARSGAVRALRNMPLDDSQKARMLAVKDQL